MLWLRIAWHLLVVRGDWCALILIRLGQHFHRRGASRRRDWAVRRLRRSFGCFVQPSAQIGPGLRLPHPNGIVIGVGVRIGARCQIYHQVTLGGARLGDGARNAYPRLGDDVVLFAGAKLIGAVTIGEGAIVGANAVVLRDVLPRHRAVGVPAVATPLKAPRNDDAASEESLVRSAP